MDLIKGTLDILILKTLASGRLHGYAISRWIQQHSGQVLNVGEGALYPALRRLEKRGWLRSRWGVTPTHRDAKFYELTAAGRRHLRADLDSWNRYVAAMSRVLKSPDQAG